VEQTVNEDYEEDNINDTLSVTFTAHLDTPNKQRFKEHVFLLKETGDLKQMVITSLTHPKNGKSARFIINSENEILEIQRAKRVPSSYFINQQVQEDGSFFITSPIDPLYLLLPRLEQVRGKKESGEGVYVDKLQIFMSDDNPNLRYVEGCKYCDLSIICDVKGDEEQKCYRLNDEKVINWLRHKVDQISEKVATLPGSMQLVRSQASGYRSKKDEKLSNDQLLNLSIGFLSEYLPPKWHSLLAESYSIKISNQAAFSFTETEYIVDTRYGTIRDKRKASETPKTTSPALKKRRIRAHEKIDTKKIKKLTSFFSPIKNEETHKEEK